MNNLPREILLQIFDLVDKVLPLFAVCKLWRGKYADYFFGRLYARDEYIPAFWQKYHAAMPNLILQEDDMKILPHINLVMKFAENIRAIKTKGILPIEYFSELRECECFRLNNPKCKIPQNLEKLKVEYYDIFIELPKSLKYLKYDCNLFLPKCPEDLETLIPPGYLEINAKDLPRKLRVFEGSLIKQLSKIYQKH